MSTWGLLIIGNKEQTNKNTYESSVDLIRWLRMNSAPGCKAYLCHCSQCWLSLCVFNICSVFNRSSPSYRCSRDSLKHPSLHHTRSSACQIRLWNRPSIFFVLCNNSVISVVLHIVVVMWMFAWSSLTQECYSFMWHWFSTVLVWMLTWHRLIHYLLPAQSPCQNH